jgi:phosphate-selective porin
MNTDIIGKVTAAAAVVLLGLPWAGRADPTAPKVTSYFQVRLTDPADDDAYLSLRRLKVMVDGSLGADAGYYFQAIYKSSNRSSTDGQPYIQELRAWYRLGRARITLGQTKPPFGWERFTNDYALALIDRSPATDHLVPSGNLGHSFARDRGMQWEWEGDRGSYSLGVFDGAGANNNPHGLGPLVVARASLDRKRPGRDGPRVVHAEAALSWRQARDLDFTGQLPGSRSLGYGHFDGHDWRYDLAAGVRHAPWEVRGEYLRAAYRPSSAGTPALTADGYYVQGSYLLSSRLEAALKYDSFDTHRGYRTEQTTIGLNLSLPRFYERLQLNYLFRDASAGYSAPDTFICQYQRYL